MAPFGNTQRKFIAHEFFPDKVKVRYPIRCSLHVSFYKHRLQSCLISMLIKGMVNLMVDATTSMLKSWESRVEGENGISEITVDEDLRSLAADIISRACFGRNYSKGEEIFSKLKALQMAMAKTDIGIPGMRYIISPQSFFNFIYIYIKYVNLLLQNIEGTCQVKTTERYGS